MRIIFCGTPDFAVPSLSSLVESGEKVVSVVSQPDRPKGRGHSVVPTPVKAFALRRGIPLMQPESIKALSFMDKLAQLKPDLIAVVAYGKIIPPPMLNLPPRGCLNVHASLLPQYRGAAPIQWALINGEQKTGITTMVIDEGLDTGDILLQEEAEINDTDTAESLGRRLSEIGASLLVKSIQGLKENILHPKPQAGNPSYAPPLKKRDGLIDWSLPSKKIYDLIRGTYPWPGAFSFLNGERITILKSELSETDHKGIPGRIEEISKESLDISTGQGILSVLELKPEGKRPMSAKAFQQGRQLREGMSFVAA